MANDINTLKIERSALAAPRRRRRWIGRVIVAVMVLALIGMLAKGLGERAIEVETASVSNAWPSSALTVLNATGYVVAQRKAAVASKATGRLEWLGVREGSVVKANEVIARLENRDMKAQVDQARAAVEVAQAQLGEARAQLNNDRLAFHRVEGLYQRKISSSADFDSAKAQFERSQAATVAAEANIRAAEANLAAAEVAYDYTSIRAPFDGVILTKNANVGDVLSPFNTGLDSKGAVVNMADMSTLEVEADVSESSLFKVAIGQPCEIQLDALPDLRLRGLVASRVPSVDRSKATVTFKVRFVENNPDVLPDMSAKVAFLSRELHDDERTPRIGVNPDALVTMDGKRAAFVVVDGKAELRPLVLGDKMGDLVVVKSGLKVGDKVILKPGERIRAGVSVKLAGSGA